MVLSFAPGTPICLSPQKTTFPKSIHCFIYLCSKKVIFIEKSAIRKKKKKKKEKESNMTKYSSMPKYVVHKWKDN